MDNSIIEAMEYLGQKIGVAIDWTSEMVWPQVLEFVDRFQIYKIATTSVGAVICVAITVLLTILLVKILFPKNKDESIWRDYYYYRNEYEWSGTAIGAFIFGVFGFAMFAAFSAMCIDDLLRWSIIPEYQFAKELMNLCS